MAPNLGPPNGLGLQLPEILASRGGGEDFWELSSKNIWRLKAGDHCPIGLATVEKKIISVLVSHLIVMAQTPQ